MKRIIILFLCILNICIVSYGQIILDSGEYRTLIWGSIESSSYLKDKKINYGQYKAHDGKFDTCWCAGKNKGGIGEWVKVNFNDWRTDKILNVITGFMIVNGVANSQEIYYKNNRIKLVELEFSEGQKLKLKLVDGNIRYQEFKIDHIKAKWLKITILDIYKGSTYNDTCISEVKILHSDPGVLGFKPPKE